MPVRPRPATAAILDVLMRAGNIAMDAIRYHSAQRALRLAFKTTNTVASTWLAELSAEENPVLLLVHSYSYGMLSSAWRGPERKHVPLSELGFPDGNRDLDDCITLRPNGSQTLEGTDDNGYSAWVVLTSTLTTMMVRTRHHVAVKRAKQREEKQMEADAFEVAHPGALAVLHSLLRSAGTNNCVSEVRAQHTGHEAQEIDGKILGGPNYVSITLYHTDIDAVTAKLRELGIGS